MKADESYCIGPAQSQQSYLNKDLILDVAKQTGAQVALIFFIVSVLCWFVVSGFDSLCH